MISIPSAVRHVLAGTFVIGMFAMPRAAQADSITFIFDYYTVNPHTAPHTPVGPSGPWGTLTLTDSVIDPFRVDVDFVGTPPAGYVSAGLEQFYLNFDSSPDSPTVPNDPDFLANHKFYLVSQDAPVAGNVNNPFTAGQILGPAGYTNGSSTYNFANFVFDLNPNPTSNALEFHGSLAFYNQIPNPDQKVNLDVAMFDLTSVLTGTQTIPMYAGYRTHNGPQSLGEFWAFASSKPEVRRVPEPTALALFGTGLLGLARVARRRFNR